MQRPRHALAELILPGQRKRHELLLRRLDRLVEQRVRILRARRTELFVEERVGAERSHALDVAGTRTPRRLPQEAERRRQRRSPDGGGGGGGGGVGATGCALASVDRMLSPTALTAVTL